MLKPLASRPRSKNPSIASPVAFFQTASAYSKMNMSCWKVWAPKLGASWMSTGKRFATTSHECKVTLGWEMGYEKNQTSD